MKKCIILMISCLLILAGCSGNNGKKEEQKEELETTVIRLAVNSSGHILNYIAESQGYLKDEGITVEYVFCNTDAEVFEGIRNGTIDIASSSGTNLPLQELSNGLDLTIFGGYLITGCMPVFARVETEWNGIEDIIGKTMACEPNLYAITGPLLDMGYDPLNQVNWYNPEDQMDRIRAVKSGEADYALVGTALNYAVISDPELKVVTYAADILPEYSCCRAEALTSWVKANPNTLKALLRAWIRAMDYYDTHHEETVAFTSKKIGVEEAAVRVYLDNPRFQLNTDPMKKSVLRAWNYMKDLGLLGAQGETINIEEHVNTQLYKSALDKCQQLYGQDNESFYEQMQALYARNNQ